MLAHVLDAQKRVPPLKDSPR